MNKHLLTNNHFFVTSISDDEVITLFADNISILTPTRTREDAKAAAHSEVNNVFIWSHQSKLNLNADKSEVCAFST